MSTTAAMVAIQIHFAEAVFLASGGGQYYISHICFFLYLRGLPRKGVILIGLYYSSKI